MKRKVYRTVIKPVILYGTEYWAAKKQYVTKMSVAEMTIVRWMCSKTRNDRIRNANTHGMVGIASIEDKLRENRLRWFGYIFRRLTDVVVR